MTYPLQFGLPQILLLLLAAGALVVLVSAVVTLEPHPAGGLRPRLRIRPLRCVSGVVLIVVALLLLWVTAIIQAYLGLTGEVKAAHVVVSPISNVPHTLSVELTQFDEDGKTASRETYQVEGDRWVLQANIVEMHRWVNILGMHSGFQVSRLYGQREDGSPTAQRHIFLAGSDHQFFDDISHRVWWTKPFVRSAYGNAVISVPGEFDVFISQDAIKTRPAR